jgi:hypothetical protein
VGAAVKGFVYSGIMPLHEDVVPDKRYASSTLFQLHGTTEQDSNATKKNTSFHQTSISREQAPKANEEPHCSKRTQEVIVRDIVPTPEKKKNTEFEKPDSDENISKAMRRLLQNNDITDISSQSQLASRILTSSCKNSAQRKQSNTKNKSTTKTTYSTSVEPTPKAGKKVFSIKKDLKCFQANGNICGLDLLDYYYSENSIKKSDCICCRVCKTWYHELRVGAFRRKTFTCGKCM